MQMGDEDRVDVQKRCPGLDNRTRHANAAVDQDGLAAEPQQRRRRLRADLTQGRPTLGSQQDDLVAHIALPMQKQIKTRCLAAHV